MDNKLLREALENKYNIGICAKIVNTKKEILLVKRSSTDTFRDLWELPGGAVELDESLEEALVREIKEETGLQIEGDIRYLDSFDFYNIETETKKRKFCFEVRTSGDILLSNDHSDWKWYTLKEISALKVEGGSTDYQIWRDHYNIIVKE